MVERLDRSREPDQDEVGSHDEREAIDDRAKLDQSGGAGAAGRAGRTVLGRAPAAPAILGSDRSRRTRQASLQHVAGGSSLV
jgi:hypothetical protein